MVELADTLDLGSSSYECRFESCHRYHLSGVGVIGNTSVSKTDILSSSLRRFGHRDVAQFGSALDLGSRGRRFESCYPDHIALVAQLAEQLICNQQVVSSILIGSSILNFGGL